MARYTLTDDLPLHRLTDPNESAAFVRAVYLWMVLGLAVTSTAAWGVASSTLSGSMAERSLPFLGLVIAQFAIVVVLSTRRDRLAASTATLLFIVYSALTGATCSFALLAVTGESVATTFVVTSGMFLGAAAYGSLTGRTLAGLGQFLLMGLIGVVLASVGSLFWHSDVLQFLVSLAGVVVFAGLAAYDAQRIEEMAYAVPAGQAGAHAIRGALALYLDFINLFLSLLGLLARRRD